MTVLLIIVFLVLNPISNKHLFGTRYILFEGKKRKQEIVIYLSILKSIQLY